MNELTIAALCLLVYSKSIVLGEVVDELQWRRSRKKASRNLFKFLTLKFYGAGTFKNLKADRAFTVFLYTIVCTLIYKALGSNDISFLTAILYCANPVNNQISIWMNGRRYVVSIIILLLIMCSPWFFALYPLVPVFQVNAIFAPFIYGWWGFLFLPLALVFYKRNSVKQFVGDRLKKIPQGERRRIRPLKVVLMIKTLSFYFYNSLFPTPKMIHYSKFQNFSITDEGNKEAYALNKDFWFSLATLLGLVALALTSKPMAFSIGFWFLFQVQWSNWVTVTQHLADRYASVPTIFLMYGLSHLLLQLPLYLLAVSIIAIVILYVTETFSVMQQYKSMEDMFQYHFQKAPECVDVRGNYIKGQIENGNYVKALVYAMGGLYYNPNDYKLNFLMGNTLLFLNHVEAEKYIKKAEDNLYIGDEEKNLKQLQVLKDELRRINDETKKLQRQGKH